MGVIGSRWFQVAFKVKGSVIPAVMPKVLLCGGFGVLVSVLSAQGLAVAWPILGNAVPSIVLGLLLVFRTNTAYDRFWEGRKAWGVVANGARNLTRRVWVLVDETKPSDRLHKQAVLRLIVVFAVAMKLHLRGESVNQELLGLVGDRYGAALQQ
jgi:ion channel-forming bestrophin family protein